jgi:hypothetical protein
MQPLETPKREGFAPVPARAVGLEAALEDAFRTTALANDRNHERFHTPG